MSDTHGHETEHPPKPRRIRVIIQAPALPRYRIAVFEELARRESLSLRIMYAQSPTLPNVAPTQFDAVRYDSRKKQVASFRVAWDNVQWTYSASNEVDVIVMCWQMGYLSLIPSLIRARLSGKATVLWGHGYSKLGGGWRQWLRHFSARLADAIVVYNHTTAAAYKALGFPRSRVHVALNTLDLKEVADARKRWLDKPDDLTAFQEQEGLNGRHVILFVSRLERDNRVDLLLDAVDTLRDSFPSILAVIIGSGEPEYSRLYALAQQKNLQEHIRFYDSIYGEDKLAPFFLSSHIFCYPENVGLSLIHAMGYGLPVITSDNISSQNPEIEALIPNTTGFLYRRNDFADLARIAHRLLADPTLASSIGQAAYAMVHTKYNISNMVDGFERAIVTAYMNSMNK